MLRSDMNIIWTALVKTNGKSNGQLLRGYVEFDSADLVANRADEERVGMVLGFDVQREADLANGKYSYKDRAGNEIYTNV